MAFLSPLQTAQNSGVDYVITDTRAGLDDVSAGIALVSDYNIVLMEQDRVSWRSSTAFVANALALQNKLKLEGSPASADNFYYLPNKVTPAFARALQALGAQLPGQLPGNILGGIPLDVNFFNRYFRNISGYKPQGASWWRTAFYRHVAASLSSIIDSKLRRVRYSIWFETKDTISLILFALSPRVTVVLVSLLTYFIMTIYVTFMVWTRGLE